jgi:hypothetical protein
MIQHIENKASPQKSIRRFYGRRSFSMASVLNVHKEEIMARFGGMGFHNTEAGLTAK